MKKVLSIHLFCASLVSVLLLSPGGSEAQEDLYKIDTLKYVRVYADSMGESHFEEVMINLEESDFAPPAPPIFTSELDSSYHYGFICVYPGWESEWHPAPKRQFVIYLSGMIEAEVSDGEIRQFGPGSLTLVEDTSGKGHKSKAIGSEKVVCVIIQLEE